MEHTMTLTRILKRSALNCLLPATLLGISRLAEAATDEAPTTDLPSATAGAESIATQRETANDRTPNNRTTTNRNSATPAYRIVDDEYAEYYCDIHDEYHLTLRSDIDAGGDDSTVIRSSATGHHRSDGATHVTVIRGSHQRHRSHALRNVAIGLAMSVPFLVNDRGHFGHDWWSHRSGFHRGNRHTSRFSNRRGRHHRSR